MFRTVPLPIIRSFSLYTQQWYMSYRFANCLRAGSGRNHFRPDPARKLSANLYDIQGQSKKEPNLFNLNLLLYLQLNQTCLLQSTPLYCCYTALSVFSSSGTRPGTCFAGWREGPVVNFLLSPLSSEIGDLLGWTSTF